MKSLLQTYIRASKRVASRGRCWHNYVIDLFIVGGIPMAMVFLILGFFASAGFFTLESSGKAIFGIEALTTSLLISFVGIPLLCVFVGSIAWLMHEVFNMD